jgi:hypothetical protein
MKPAKKAVVAAVRRGGTRAQPTMRLINLANSATQEAKFGLKPLETSAAMATPIAHSEFELIALPEPPQQRTRGMPWEEDDATFLRFRASLPCEVTADIIYEKVARPTLELDASAPQRSDEWHEARRFAVTASQFASASNENPTFSQAKLLTSKTYPKSNAFTGNAFTEWGAQHEKHAEEAFVQFLCEKLNATAEVKGEDVHFSDGSKLTHCAHKRGLIPFLGFSPDALLWSSDASEVALVEYKCPAYQRSGPGHPYANKNELNIPRQYMPQIQGSLHILRECYPATVCVRSWFVVWQAHQFFVTHVPYVESYASRIVSASSSFFKDQFLPACAEAVSLRDGILKANQIPSAIQDAGLPISEE